MTTPTSGSASGPARLMILAVLGVLLVAALVVAAVGFTSRSAPGFGVEGQPQQVQRAREDVMAQAEQFMLRVNTYGPDLLEGTTMPKYRELVSQVITPKFGTDFEKNVPAAEATVAQARLERTTSVLSTGVSTLDDDSATVLVAGSYTNSFPAKPGAKQRVKAPPSPYRVEVDLVKIDGTWLVDNFDPVTGLDDDAQSQGQQSTDPSTDPTAVTSP